MRSREAAEKEPTTGRVASRAAEFPADLSRAGEPLPPPPGLAGGPDFSSLWAALRRRWLLASCLGVAAAVVVGVAGCFLLPVKYLAYATVQVATYAPTMRDRFDSRQDLKPVVKTQSTRFKSRDVLMGALNQDSVRNLRMIRRFPDTLSVVTWLDEELKVDFQDDNELVTVSVSGDDPDELVALVNGLTGAYLNIVNGKETALRKDRTKKMQAIADSLKEKLSEKIATLQGMYKGQGAPDSQSMMQKQHSLLIQLAEAQKLLNGLNFELERTKARLALHRTNKKTASADDIPEHQIKQLLESDAVNRAQVLTISNLQKLVTRLEVAGHPDSDFTLASTRWKLAMAERAMERSRESLRADLIDRYKKKLEADHKQIEDGLVADIAPLATQLQKTQERVDQLVRETEVIDSNNPKRDQLKLDIAQDERQYAETLKNLQTFQVEEESENRISQCQDAVWQVKDPKRRLIILCLLPLAAFAATCLGVAFWGFRQRRIHGADEVTQGLGLRLLGSVPTLTQPHRRQRFLGVQAEGYHDHNLIESIDGIRTMLLRNASVEPMQVVMVTSAVGGEGKTTLASNLAVSLARAGRKTLLIDCDLRQPALHGLFEQTLEPGFSEAVLGEVDLADAVRPTTTDLNLFLLPAGQWDREVLAELAKDTLGAIFERLKSQFDYIIVDSHPVLPATDSLLIGQHTDAVIVSLLRNVSETPRVYAAQQKLATLGIHVFGAVVSGVPTVGYGKGFSYQHAAAAAA